ncbi:MAG: hypothetical protein KBS77_03630 [Bacteroidales bacterium]|nr:hypothetical protein [Candidatus Colicola faecequi]
MRKVSFLMLLCPLLAAAQSMITSFPHITIFQPDFRELRLQCIDRPSEQDSSIMLCCAGAFTHDALTEFGLENIDGNHVSCSQVFEGNTSPDLTGVFLWCEYGYLFLKKSDSQIAECTAKQYVTAFEQALVILDGEKVDFPIKKYYEYAQHYRVLAEWNGRLCMIESDVTTMDVFTDAMLKAGVTNAIYTDMGGWKFAWYRADDGSVKHIHPVEPKTKYQSNWLCFIK